MNQARTTWWWRPFRLGLALGLVLIAVGWAAIKIASRTGLNRELAEARAKGLPTNPGELNRWYAAVPTNENASLKFLDATQVLVEPARDKDPGDIDWREIPNMRALDPKTMAVLEGHLKSNAAALRLMSEAAGLPRSRYPMDLSKAPDVSLTHLMHLKRLAQLARWEAVFKAEEGDAVGAVEALNDGFALAHTLAQEPLVISELVRIACLAIQIAGFERVVNVVKLDESQRSEMILKVRAASEDCRQSLHRALIGERAFANTGRKMTYSEYEQLITLGGMSPNPSWVPEVFRKLFYYARRSAGVQDRDQAFYMRSLGRMIDAAGLSFPELLAASDAVTADISVELAKHPIAYEISALTLPTMFRIPSKEALLAARLRCVETALAVEQWRGKNNGRLPRPDEIPPLLANSPRDAVNGASLKFQANDHGGYRIVAVGASAEEKKGGVNSRSPGIGFPIER